MRERFVVILVSLIIGVIVLFAVPRAYLTADLVERHQTEDVDRAVRFIEARVESRLGNNGTVDALLLASALEPSDGAVYTDREGIRVTAGTVDLDPETAIVEKQRLSSGATIVVTRDRSVIRSEVREAVLPLFLLGLALAVSGAAIAFIAAGRATRGFRELADAADELGQGHFDLDVPDRGVPEVLAIGTALQGAAARLDELVRREREFSVNASHQLRTPITALRLELEDLTYWPQTSPEVAQHLRQSIGELDRLTASIEDLLDLARQHHGGRSDHVDLNEIIEAVAQRWRRQFAREQDRALLVQLSNPRRVDAPAGIITQILDVLIDNARLHGRGVVTLTATSHDGHTSIRVGDEGERTFGTEIFRRGITTRAHDGAGTGIGLAVAVELAESVGAHLSLDDQESSTTFVLLLSSRPRTP